MTDAEKRLAEFYKEFAHVKETDRHYHNPWIPEMKSFLVESIHQAVAESQEQTISALCRVLDARGIRVPDIASLVEYLQKELNKKE